MNFRALQYTNKVPDGQVIAALGISADTLRNWQEGITDPPHYIALTMKALGKHLSPLTSEQMYGVSVVTTLNVSHDTEWNWRLHNRWPAAARFACAYLKSLESEARPPTEYQKQLLQNINDGRYYRITGGWRSRPVMGRNLPNIRYKTGHPLLNIGWIRQTDNGILKITPRGKKWIS